MKVEDFVSSYQNLKQGKNTLNINSLPDVLLHEYLINQPINNKITNPFLALDYMRQTAPDLNLIDSALLTNEVFIIQALSLNPENLSHIHAQYITAHVRLWYIMTFPQVRPLQFFPEYTDELSLGLYLVDKDDNNFQDLSENLRNNIEIYHLATRRSLEHTKWFSVAGDDIVNDKTCAYDAIRLFPQLYQSVGESLKNDVNFFITICPLDCFLLNYASSYIKNNSTCVLHSIQYFSESLQYASDDLKCNREFAVSVFTALKDDNFRFQKSFVYWDKSIRSDFDLMISILSLFTVKTTMQLVDESLLNNIDFIKKACSINPQWYSVARSSITHNSQNFIDIYNSLITDKQQYYQEKSNANSLFSFLPSECVNNIYFISELYCEYHLIFHSIVLPQLNKHTGTLIEQIKAAGKTPQDIKNFMNKIKLHQSLEQDLNKHGQSSHINKI